MLMTRTLQLVMVKWINSIRFEEKKPALTVLKKDHHSIKGHRSVHLEPASIQRIEINFQIKNNVYL
jgi:hypothetical protein